MTGCHVPLGLDLAEPGQHLRAAHGMVSLAADELERKVLCVLLVGRIGVRVPHRLEPVERARIFVESDPLQSEWHLAFGFLDLLVVGSVVTESLIALLPVEFEFDTAGRRRWEDAVLGSSAETFL